MTRAVQFSGIVMKTFSCSSGRFIDSLEHRRLMAFVAGPVRLVDDWQSPAATTTINEASAGSHIEQIVSAPGGKRVELWSEWTPHGEFAWLRRRNARLAFEQFEREPPNISRIAVGTDGTILATSPEGGMGSIAANGKSGRKGLNGSALFVAASLESLPGGGFTVLSRPASSSATGGWVDLRLNPSGRVIGRKPLLGVDARLTFVRDVDRLADGKLLISASRLNELERPISSCLYRFNADGSLDSGFGRAGVAELPSWPMSTVVLSTGGSASLLGGDRFVMVSAAGVIDATATRSIPLGRNPENRHVRQLFRITDSDFVAAGITSLYQFNLNGQFVRKTLGNRNTYISSVDQIEGKLVASTLFDNYVDIFADLPTDPTPVTLQRRSTVTDFSVTPIV
jgi:hypothetical protein